MVAALAGTATLLVVEGAAGAGKTTTLAAARRAARVHGHRLVVVTPTLKAARVAEAAGRRRRVLGGLAGPPARLPVGRGRPLDPRRTPSPTRRARLLPGDLLLVDEAGMLDQDTARALLTIADETGARVAFVGDRHQLPAVGRGGVLDHAARWARPRPPRAGDRAPVRRPRVRRPEPADAHW